MLGIHWLSKQDASMSADLKPQQLSTNVVVALALAGEPREWHVPGKLSGNQRTRSESHTFWKTNMEPEKGLSIDCYPL